MNSIVLVLGSIAAIILLSSRYKLNTVLVLIGLAVTVGLLAGFPGGQVLTYVRTGFGQTLEKIGLLIVLGTVLGSMLDRSNATGSIANFILSRVGTRQTPLAVALIGFAIGLPIFCDSAFIVLSGFVLALAQRLGRFHLRFVLSLSGSLYAVHCLVPPHPGITAAVGIFNIDIGQMMVLGTVLAIPGTVVSYVWAKFADARFGTSPNQAGARPGAIQPETSPIIQPADSLPAPTGSFLAILVPIALIAAKPLLLLNAGQFSPVVGSIIGFIGDPVVALSVGVGIAVYLFGRFDKNVFNAVVDEAIHKAGPVLIIVGAGGAFGEVIKHLGLETTILGLARSAGSAPQGVSIWIPFLLTVVFKTAQGSSTVAILSVASLLQPLLPGLGAVTNWDHLLVLGAMGAGSMTLSHANDAYFWVVSRFGQVDTGLMLRSYSLMSALMGLATMVVLWLIQAVSR